MSAYFSWLILTNHLNSAIITSVGIFSNVYTITSKLIVVHCIHVCMQNVYLSKLK